MKLRPMKNFLLGITATALIASCTSSEDEAPVEAQSEVTIAATLGSSINDAGARTSDLIQGNFKIQDVKLSVDNVKLILRATSQDSKKPTIVQIRDRDPQILDLVDDGEIKVAPIGSAMAYDGVYGKLTLDLVHADVPEEDDMSGYSVMIKASWFDIPAIVNVDLEGEWVVQFNQGIEVDGAQEMLLTMYYDKILEDVPPSLVGDGNGDGLIELGPNNVDDNGEAYDMIVANMEKALVMKNGKFKD